MADTTSTTRPKIIGIRETSARAVSYQDVSVAAAGDTHTQRWDFLPGVSAITAESVDVVSGGGTLTREFRWAQDVTAAGGTWSAWAPVAGITAIVPDTALPLYLEFRYSLSGVVVTPTVVRRQTVLYTNDPNRSTLGLYDPDQLHQDAEAFIQAVALAASPRRALGSKGQTAAVFDFQAGHPDKCGPGGKPVAYVHRIDVREAYRGHDRVEFVVEARVGLKRECGTERSHWNAMKTALKQRLSSKGNDFEYALQFGGAYHLKARPGHLGVLSLQTIGDSEVEQGQCGCVRWEMAVRFSIMQYLTLNQDIQ